MSKINILSPFVADLIAAGEVVERAASVIKELIENSVDAGSQNITAEIKDGGASYIRVTDDGCGMSAEDAGVAFFRHATSKLSDENGLAAIGTLGFRGEALAAIGSVSDSTMLTREKTSGIGTKLSLLGGEITELSEHGCPVGTTIIIKSLFYNTPARLKFMKSDRAESAACLKAAMQQALGHPHISFRFIRDGREEFFTPGDGKPLSAIYSLLGREIVSELIPVISDDGNIKATGYISSPPHGRGNRTNQFFFCNGRYIRSQLLTAAVEQAYKNTLSKGRYPSCVIYLEIAANAVDVNVHPAKTEVRFSDERRVFDAVYYAALGALEGKNITPAKHENADNKPADGAIASEIKGEKSPYMPAAKPSGSSDNALPWGSFFEADKKSNMPEKEEKSGISFLRSPIAEFEPLKSEINADDNKENATDMPALNESLFSGEGVATDNLAAEPDFVPVIIGEAFNLYCFVQAGNELLLIDKHAAHERIIFDRLINEKEKPGSQTLLEPVIIKADAKMLESIEKDEDIYKDLGFDAAVFGFDRVIIRAVPFGLDAAEAGETLEELSSALSNPQTAADEKRDEALKTVACKAAIKAGQHSAGEEILELAKAVLAGKVKYCPHGRPVSYSFSKKDLEKLFLRSL